jgi:hypothetical protein
MPERVERQRVALDVNFPESILRAFDLVIDVELVPLREIDRRLIELDDRSMVLALRQEGFDWLATNNYRMLRNPEELAAIMKAHMKVFAIQGVGDDPLKATGALLLDLPGAMKRAVPGQSQVFWSRPRAPTPRDPWDVFTEAADHRHQRARELYEQVKVTDEEAATPWADFVG